MAGWNGVADCEVLVIEPFQLLSYRWCASGDQEQSGFRTEDEAGYRAMGGGWPRILGRLQDVAAGMD